MALKVVPLHRRRGQIQPVAHTTPPTNPILYFPENLVQYPVQIQELPMGFRTKNGNREQMLLL
ncbi:MAG: hypothetical protein IJU53_12160, partial [Thermoguttaceae bacterium]|nr:hypothetical protein [Thermoguttaceae bacterium]